MSFVLSMARLTASGSFLSSHVRPRPTPNRPRADTPECSSLPCFEATNHASQAIQAQEEARHRSTPHGLFAGYASRVAQTSIEIPAVKRFHSQNASRHRDTYCVTQHHNPFKISRGKSQMRWLPTPTLEPHWFNISGSHPAGNFRPVFTPDYYVMIGGDLVSLC
ncbi:hypothetical protein B0H65DRAFT_50381 [Neurospora tetraspora]|uniref:Uncharacterized protein n=1 Tax=Neurospora tetraspora TaxID=94610 RepID=A0AAE0JPQ9_9PEZI|nr:hypothetical protein B0H65DRAFT_50381 [Neurospora tetraspora]